ncbi:hypothetical protein ACFQGT_02175 [Natrialbaceae archaeon GCM10025810]|uniref:DUF7853 family protein n=1 Tax=Halovalidus salilacus TaxID=3075124 RepID=UPI0036080C74
MPATSRSPDPIALPLALEAQWTLHHVLLDRIEREETAADSADVDPPSLEIYQAFETLERGETRFTAAQLEAIRDLLATYQRSTDWWELERSALEDLLADVSTALEDAPASASVDPAR